MKSWLRVFLICFALLGGTAFFGYWYIIQLNHVFDDLNAYYNANTHSTYSSFNKPNVELASTTPEIEGLATTTDVLVDPTQATTTDALVNSTTTDAIIETLVTVLDTGIGYLNVRKGPGLGFGKETQVDVGGVFKLLDEQGDWAQIEVSSTTSGWVLKKYIEKQQF